MICPNCHSEISDEALFCSECGQKIIKVEEPVDKRVSSVGSRVQNREKKKQDNNKKAMMIIGVVAAILIVAIACYFLFFKKSDDKSETAVTEETTTEKNDTKIKLKKSSITLKVGDTDYIEANIDCKYTVKDESICKVDSFGTVKGLKAGKTTVTCKGENGTKATCKITVEEADEVTESTDGDYVFPNSSTVLLTESDLEGKSEWDLRIGINEIYARHHCTFKTQEIVDYFNSKSWYSADPNMTSDKMNADVSAYLNDIEVKNVNFIRKYQESH